MEKTASYRLMIVAYGASLLQILTFVKNLKKENPSAVIHLLTNLKMDSITCHIKDYLTRVYQIREYSGRFRKRSVGVLFNKGLFLCQLFFLSLAKKYDVVNIHFAKPSLLKAMPLLNRMTNNIVITPWGSDVLRLEDERAINRMRQIYSYASCVTVRPYSQAGIEIAKKFHYDPQKMLPLRWGLEYVDYLEEATPNKSMEESKKRFGLSDRYVITCGYSTAPSHRHEAIIDAVNSVRGQLPSNLTLLFPFTYGWGSKEYVQSIKDKCLSLNLDAVYVEEYLNFEDLYTLRMATDMFVHVQTTDAGASCVMQYILCQKKIVHGSWMKYVDLEQFSPLFYYPVNSMEDLGRVILDAYHSDGIAIPEGVIKTIMDRGWNKVMKNWNGYFRSLIE